MSSIQRWQPVSEGEWMQRDGRGDYVLYADHMADKMALLAAKDEEIVNLRKCLTDVLACINETRGKNADEAVHAARQALAAKGVERE